MKAVWTVSKRQRVRASAIKKEREKGERRERRKEREKRGKEKLVWCWWYRNQTCA